MTRTHIGILGGGQLARMLALSAHPLGLGIAVLAGHPDEPAAQVCGHNAARCGQLDDKTALKRFVSGLNYLTFESEFINTDLVAQVASRGCHIFPALRVIGAIQDRLQQKQLLDQCKIPTSPWLEVNSESDLEKAARLFPHGLVLKQRRFGYDGYGTFIIRHPLRELDMSLLSKSKFGFIAEEFIPFKRELAISYVRSQSGQFIVLPLVESVQVHARCFSVHGPLAHPAVKKITAKFKRLMEELNYQGILAVEMFETQKGLVVNELAPRVHNSAHYSLDALTCSQFEYHLRAGLGLPLPAVELLRPGFAMVNLLGTGLKSTRLNWSTAGHLHWYGKTENRPGRKMGHINVLGASPQLALKRAVRWQKDFKI